MFATTHALAAVVLTQPFSHLPWIFGVSALSHILLDLTPHGDLRLIGKTSARSITTDLATRQGLSQRFLVFAAADLTVLLIILTLLFLKSTIDPTKMLVAASGGIFFDVLGATTKFFHLSFFNPFHRWHLWLHLVISKHLPKGDLSPAFSILVQVLFVTVVLGMFLS